MKQFKFDVTENPVFNTVGGLSNTTFDPENVVPNRGATEGQLKSVSDIITELRDFLDEQGCDDPWAYIKQKVDELEAAQSTCCETDWGQGATETIAQRLDELEAQIEGCCTQDHGEQDIQQILDRIDDLEAQINDCCNRTCAVDSAVGQCDGNTITVSFVWNGNNPLQDGGQATAVSADATRSIAGYYFLIHDPTTGLYYKRNAAFGGDWTWNIAPNGAVTATETGAGGTRAISHAIVAVDEQGCEGMIGVDLPSYSGQS